MTAADRNSYLLDRYPVDTSVQRWHRAKLGGGQRSIVTPNNELKRWLRLMNAALIRQFNDWPTFMHGGIKKRGYVTHARQHVARPCVITIDIKSCFDSITEREVADAMQRHLGLDDDVCARLANVLCFRGAVAQGFPTSNYICNLYLLDPLSSMHSRLSVRHIRLSNYVDDIAVSGTIVAPGELVNEIALNLSRAKLSMNKAKVSVMPSSKRQVVCGLVVNKRLSLTSTLKLKLLGDVAHGRMSPASVAGWIANLKSIDPVFGTKLHQLAMRKALLKS